MGGAGFIGSNCAKRFVKGGWKVTVVDGLMKNTGGNKENLHSILSRIEFFEKPVQEAENLSVLIDKSDLIIDCMAWTLHHLAVENPEYDLELNVSSHLPLIKNLKQYPGKRVIYLGSRGQYGNPSCPEINEDTPMIPQDIQGINKLAGESYFRFYSKLYKFHIVSLRIANCFGENQLVHGSDIGLVGSFIRDAINGNPIEIFGTNRKRPLIYVKDLAEIIFRLRETPFEVFTCYNVNVWNMLIRDIASTVIEVLGKGTLVEKELPNKIRNMDVGSAEFNSSRITSLLGTLPLTPFEDAVKKTINYFKKRNNS